MVPGRLAGAARRRGTARAARRFDELGVAETEVPTPPPIEATVRALRPPVPQEHDTGAYSESRDGTAG